MSDPRESFNVQFVPREEGGVVIIVGIPPDSGLVLADGTINARRFERLKSYCLRLSKAGTQ